MGLALRRSAPELIRRSSRVEQPGDPKPTDREEGSLKLETYLVNLNVSATDRAGRAIPDLKKEDFSVYEDGVLQRTSFFSPQRSLLIDLSGSMRDEIDIIKETAMHFLDIISSTDSVAMVTFSTDVVVVSQLTRDRDDLRDSIDYMLPPVGGTAFYDALGFVLVETLRKVKGQRNAVIAITDGEDNALQAHLYFRPASISIAAGSFLTFEELLDGAKEADALIYPIHLDPALPQLITPPSIRTSPGAPTPRVQIQTNTDRQKLLASALTDLAKEQLHGLADASGGRFYHANRIDDLKGVFEQVAAELRTVYSMAYTPTNLNFDGRFRRIKVRVNRPEVVIRTRPGYYGR
jgi:VWFA-related protein